MSSLKQQSLQQRDELWQEGIGNSKDATVEACMESTNTDRGEVRLWWDWDMVGPAHGWGQLMMGSAMGSACGGHHAVMGSACGWGQPMAGISPWVSSICPPGLGSCSAVGFVSSPCQLRKLVQM